jgi:UDP-GlcNAc:undecaprenyl-phosphate GlcNAc-1-phosphate transferase
VSAVLGAVVRRWWPGYLSDFPGGALGHRVAVPLCGGFVVWLSCFTVFVAAGLTCAFGRAWLPERIVRHVDGLWYRSGELAVVLGLATLTMLAGLVADLFDLGWRPRLALQVALAAGLAALGTRVTLFWPFSYPVVGGLVTVLWVVGLVNAFTFLDNMDGLAAGVGLIASLLFAATQVEVGSLFAPAALLVVAGALGGVWFHNRYPARLFLGTSGSWLIGFLLGALTIAGTYYRYGMGDSPNSVLSPLLVMAVPFYESLVVFLVWLGERDQPFLNNPRHFSYRLGKVGLSPSQSVGMLLLVSLGAGLGSLLLRRLDAFGTAVLLAQTACLIGVVAVVEVSAIRRGRRDGPARAAVLPAEDVSDLAPPA